MLHNWALDLEDGAPYYQDPIEKFSKPEQAFYYVYEVGKQIFWDGFQLAAVNAGDELVKLPWALREVGATRCLAVCEAALELLPDELGGMTDEQRSKSIDKLPEEVGQKLDALDRELYALIDESDSKMRDYLSRNRDQVRGWEDVDWEEHE